MDQFDSSYEGDPETELLTSVSSTLLGFENATISYSSSDENVFYFDNSDNKVVLHAKDYGKATITITVSYNGTSKSQTIEIEYKKPVTYDSINISDVYKKEFTPTDVECREQKKGYVVILDESAFYPEGGGQRSDVGILGDAQVTAWGCDLSYDYVKINADYRS